MRQQIPNIITLLNLFLGCLAIVSCFQFGTVASISESGEMLIEIPEKLYLASLFIGLAAVVDFLDGYVARLLNVPSEMGKQLDSLADVVTSGLVPGIIMYKLLALTVESEMVSVTSWASNPSGIEFNLPTLPLLGLLITLASAYRLAKFNLDEDQQTYFKGLPTPANTLLIISLPLIIEFQNNDAINTIILNKWFLIGLTFLSCYLLNSGIKLFALKFKNYSFKGNATRYIFIILCLVLLIVLKFAAIPIIILLYISMSVLDNLTSK